MSVASLPVTAEPFAVSFIDGRYLLFDAELITYVRREHRICGVLIGTLAQVPQQNVFLGVPLELMPEEALLLLKRGAAYIVDEEKTHSEAFSNLTNEARQSYQHWVHDQGIKAALEADRIAAERKAGTLRKLKNRNRDTESAEAPSRNEESLFGPHAEQTRDHSLVQSETRPFGITPATSYPPLKHEGSKRIHSLPAVLSSYPLYEYLNEKGYFISPGLRFGCQYLAYPGDPLRFHSHFLAVSPEWDEEIDLLDLVAGGRLGTGVKKGFLLGSPVPKTGDASREEDVRAFCIEWSGM